jgi:hypothetical protein
MNARRRESHPARDYPKLPVTWTPKNEPVLVSEVVWLFWTAPIVNL